MGNLIELDATDRRLLRALQKDARVSTQALADAAGISASPAWRRVRRLEEAGIITRHVALLDARQLGLATLAYINVSLTDHAEATVAKFDQFIRRQDQVVECARIAGNSDYLLKVMARDAEDLETFLLRGLLATGVVRATTTNIALRQTKWTTELPLD